MEKYTEEDVGQVAYAASIQDNTHEGKSIVDLSEEKKYIPPMLEKLISAKVYRIYCRNKGKWN